MMKIKRKPISAPRIEMLPLIDIVFLLLVFFIYAMLSMAVHRGQAVDLPQSESAALETDEAISITIQTSDEGVRLFLDEELVNFEDMSSKLKEKKSQSQKSEDSEVLIFADKQISYQMLFQVLDQVKKAGITHISLQAEQEGKTK